MSELLIDVTRLGDGTTVAQINGKVFTLLAGYEHPRADGWFFLAVAGKTPLRPDDLDKHWAVVRSGAVSLAFSQRTFSYHLSQGEGEGPPYGCDWPKLKAPPGYYAFVGLSEGAVRHQVQLMLDQYRPTVGLEAAMDRAIQVEDIASRNPNALLIPF